jgi:hypothetical protein
MKAIVDRHQEETNLRKRIQLPVGEQGHSDRGALLDLLQSELRDLADGFDCDTGANWVHAHYCRSCRAAGLLEAFADLSPASAK